MYSVLCTLRLLFPLTMYDYHLAAHVQEATLGFEKNREASEVGSNEGAKIDLESLVEQGEDVWIKCVT